jgi:hypothetical protein
LTQSVIGHPRSLGHRRDRTAPPPGTRLERRVLAGWKTAVACLRPREVEGVAARRAEA